MSSAFLTSAAAEGILGLLHASVAATGAAERLPPALAEGLRAGAHRQVALELAHRVELRRVVAATRSRGLDVLLMKGASLAYDVYPDPAWRVRSDVDMFIRAADRAGSARASTISGTCANRKCRAGSCRISFTVNASTGMVSAISATCTGRSRTRSALPTRLDSTSSPSRAVPLPLLGPGARGLGRMHALWLACVHRAAHHYDQDTLVWLYDVHLLMGALDADEIARFVALAERTGVRRICLRALLLARERFGTEIPPGTLAELEAAPENEPSTVFLRPGVRMVDVLLDDVRVLPGWRARMMLLKEHLFPDAAYMRRTYANGSSAPTLWLYARRIVTGAAKWFRR